MEIIFSFKSYIIDVETTPCVYWNARHVFLNIPSRNNLRINRVIKIFSVKKSETNIDLKTKYFIRLRLALSHPKKEIFDQRYNITIIIALFISRIKINKIYSFFF